MGELIDLFSRRKVPTEQVTPDFVEDFIETHLGDFVAAARDLDEAKTEGELEEYMGNIQRLVARWPKPKR